ncbi:MAG: Gfo/Idh/MocA family oxidoreductase [Alphaproteobacteria bacterium]|nr:Gfo/Idh/MocA family oxidoreductase [Alphaproteobacteria bacterium]
MTAPWRVGIVGCGIAGRARAKAVHGHPRTELVAVHRGRFAATLGAPEVGADALLAAVDVVIVAAPSETHGDWVARALDAGRHVICEYPLARTRAGAEGLLEAARAGGRVLHVEHIELLAPTTRWMAAELHGGWSEAHLSFASPGDPWADGATHAWTAVSRLHRIVAAHGWPEILEVARADGEAIEAILRWGQGRELSFEARRTPDLPRRLHWRCRVPQGVIEVVDRAALRDGEPVALGPTALFAEDLDVAIRRIEGEDAGYLADERLLGVLSLAESLGRPGTTAAGVKAP